VSETRRCQQPFEHFKLDDIEVIRKKKKEKCESKCRCGVVGVVVCLCHPTFESKAWP
jgi:hypothetical protein